MIKKNNNNKNNNNNFPMIAIVSIVAIIALVIIISGNNMTDNTIKNTQTTDYDSTNNIAGNAMATQRNTTAIKKAKLPSCTDSDGGYNIFKNGTLTWYINGTQYINTDYCVNNSLTEFYCVGSNSVSNVTSCQYGCNNGACNNEPAYICNDTDGGNNIILKGTTFIELEGVIVYNSTEYCVNNNTVMESFCQTNSGWHIQSNTVNCNQGCFNGRCNGQEIMNKKLMY